MYGKLFEDFIGKMTSPEAGQFKLEIPTFKIILDRAKMEKPQLAKLKITDDGIMDNKLGDTEESLEAMNLLLNKSINFISSLIGEELARDVIKRNMRENMIELSGRIKKSERLMGHIPEPFGEMLDEVGEEEKISGDHAVAIRKFDTFFTDFIKELSKKTDLSALKLKLSILREENEILKGVILNSRNRLEFDMDIWNGASDEEVGEAIKAILDSLIGLSVFMVGEEEASKKTDSLLIRHLKDEEEMLERYGLDDRIPLGYDDEKISTGFKPLDNSIGGGLDKGSSVLLISPSGIERDHFILDMFRKGLDKGESLLFVTSKDPPKSIKSLLKSRDIDPDDLEKSGRLRIVDWFSWRGERIIGVEREGKTLKSSKILSNLGIAINKAIRELDDYDTKLAMIHFIGPAIHIFDFSQVYNFVQRLRAKFKEKGVVSIFLLETEIISKEDIPRIKEIFDGVLEIKKTVVGKSVHREISVLNMGGIDFDARSIPFRIIDKKFVELKDEEGHKSPTVKRIKKREEKDATTLEKEIPETEDVETWNNVEVIKPIIKRRIRKVAKKTKSSKGKRGKTGKKRVDRIEGGKKKPIVVRRIRRKKNASVENRNESPDLLIKDALKTIDELLNVSDPNLKDYENRPIRVKKVVQNRK